jgi:rRNA maturation RNase YbeY
MQIKIGFRASKAFPPRASRSIKKAIRATLASLPNYLILQLNKKARTGELTVFIVGTKKMQELNYRYRNKNKATDVLSFSRLESPMPYQPILDIGDLVICLPVAKQQAKLFGEPIHLELQRLAVHGTLHLFGFDHEKNRREEKRMFRLQNKVLRSLSSKHLES